MKIKKFFQNLFKLIIRKIFIFIYGSVKFEENSNIPDLKIYTIKNDKIISFLGKIIMFIKFIMAEFIMIMLKMLQCYQIIEF